MVTPYNSLKMGDFNISPYYFLKRKTEISLNFGTLCHFDIVLWITWQEIASFPYNSMVLAISKNFLLRALTKYSYTV